MKLVKSANGPIQPADSTHQALRKILPQADQNYVCSFFLEVQGVAIGVRRYLKDLHDPKDEPECEHPVDWSFDNALQPTKRAIQLAIYGVRGHGWPHQLKAHVLGG